MNSGNKVLIVDDEEDILELLSYSLEKEGFEVSRATNGLQGLEMAKRLHPEVIILDIMMPGMDGITLCRNLRADGDFRQTLILILTARGEEYSEIAGFDAGADDYIVKPVKIRSLVKRLEAMRRRENASDAETFEGGDLKIDASAYRIQLNGKDLKLPRKEFELLALLARHPNKVVKRETILREVWGNDGLTVDRTIDVHIRRIRKKIGESRIETIKGVGYKLLRA